MFRLGLRLTLQSSKEALVRLALTAVAISIGVVLLLAMLADFHAFQVTSRRPAWETTSAATAQGDETTRALWNYSESIYKGQFIEQVRFAALGSNAPLLPGLQKNPLAGQYYVSPALQELLQTVSYDTLGARFSGQEAGVIGDGALANPGQLVIYMGYDAATLRAIPNTITIDQIAKHAASSGTTNIYRLAFGFGLIILLFPLLIFINTATRLAAARREERYAAMRLIGATPRQISTIAATDAVVSALFGSILGVLMFLLVRPAIANVSLSGVQFFAGYVTPTIFGYIGILALVPLASAAAALFSLRRVQISPLGVSHKATSKPPTIQRAIPLLIGVPIFLVPVILQSSALKGQTSQHVSLVPEYIGLLLIMVGLITGGSWLTLKATALVGKISKSAATLLAVRRLSDNPKAAFRSVSGVVLAVFVGSAIAILIPTINRAQSPAGGTSLNSVLRVSYVGGMQSPGLDQTAATKLITGIKQFNGVSVVPIYMNPDFAAPGRQGPDSGPMAPPSGISANDSVVSCADLAHIPALGTCANGTTAVAVDAGQLMSGDNPLAIYKSLPLASSSSISSNRNIKTLATTGLLISSSDSDTLEKVRTYLTNYSLTSPSSEGRTFLTGWQMGSFEAQTFAEIAQIRNNDASNVEKIVLAGMLITLIVASCSLAVTVGGSVIERKRPFTLLRLSGVSNGTLYKVILLESLIPLIAASVVAALTGIGIMRPVIKSLVTPGTPIANPNAAYYASMGVGLLIAIAVISTTLPLLKRLTRPEDAQFE